MIFSFKIKKCEGKVSASRLLTWFINILTPSVPERLSALLSQGTGFWGVKTQDKPYCGVCVNTKEREEAVFLSALVC